MIESRGADSPGPPPDGEGMPAGEWARVKEILADALALDATERAGYLDRLGADDPALRATVQQWLALHDPEFLERSPVAAGEPWPAGDAVSAGANVGPFRLLRVIGRGGMGAVYLAERVDGEFDRRVAIKISAHGLDPSEHRRLRHERQILAALDHPHIARLLDGGTTPAGQPYFAMEYIDGQPLNRYCEDRGLSIDERLALFCTVCTAVEYAHQHLVVHRDIKPANVLVTSDGVPKLLDFGIAKLLGPVAPAVVTATRTLTPAYASPEQVRGEPITTLSDVYSLGVLLYELLTGAHPYGDATSDLESVARLLDGPAPGRPSAKPELSPPAKRALRGNLDTIVQRAMHRDPHRRYPSVHALRSDLERHRRHQPVMARPDTLWYRTTTFVRRNRWSSLFAAGALVSLVAGLVAFAWEARVAAEQRAAADRQVTSVRTLALSLLFDVHDSIADLPGATRARQFAVNRALGVLDTLAREPVGSGADRRRRELDLAAALVKAGDVQGQPYHANVGDTEGAMRSYRRAAALLSPYAVGTHADSGAQRPADTLAMRLLAITETRIGASHLRRRQWADAEAAESRAIAALEALQAHGGVESTVRMAIGQAQLHLGDALSASDELGSLDRIRRARVAYAQALAAFAPETTTAPVSRQVARSIGSTYSRLAYSWSSEAELTHQPALFDQALKYHRLANAMLAAALARHPTDYLLRRAVADGRMDIANIEAQRHHPREALPSLDSAGAIFRALARDDPANVEARRDLAYFAENRSNVLLQLGRGGAASAEARAAVVQLRALRRVDPASGEDFFHLAHAERLLGDARRLVGDTAGAVAAYTAASRTIRGWQRAEPEAVRAAQLASEVRAALRGRHGSR